jgi:hypothetical protein
MSNEQLYAFAIVTASPKELQAAVKYGTVIHRSEESTTYAYNGRFWIVTSIQLLGETTKVGSKVGWPGAHQGMDGLWY